MPNTKKFEALVDCLGHFTFTKGQVYDLTEENSVPAVGQGLVKPVTEPVHEAKEAV